jgi:solute carrier family 25 phosphate transporter 23/24/25/41
MSSTGETKRTILEASRRLWAMGGMHAYYRGLVVNTISHHQVIS